MSKKLRITYFKNVCVGNAQCIKKDSKHFSILNNKAVLKDSKELINEAYILEGKFSSSDYNKLIEAAKACPVNAITVYDIDNNKEIVGTSIRYSSKFKELKAKYDDNKEFKLDEKGYFLIRLDRKNKNIEVAFCKSKNIIEVKITGKTPVEIYTTIIKENLISNITHAAYLGRELQKAYIALQNNIAYIQDEELDFSKKLK